MSYAPVVNRSITIRVDAALLASLKTQAASDGRTLSDYVRRVLAGVVRS